MSIPPRQVFIGGSGRSGTTVLGQALAKHPEVVGIDQEVRIHIDPGGALDLVQALGPNWSPYVADSGIQNFLDLVEACRRRRLWTLPLARWGGRTFTPPRYATLKFDQDFGRSTVQQATNRLLNSVASGVSRSRWTGSRAYRFRPTFFESDGPQDAQEGLRRFFGDLFAGRGMLLGKRPSVWVDHTPFNILHVERLAAMFPNSVFVMVVRHPLAVFDSYMEQAWASNAPLSTARRLLAVAKEGERQMASLAPERALRVRLEDLSQTPAATVEAVLNRVGLRLERASERALNSISVERATRHGASSPTLDRAEEDVVEVLSEFRSVWGYE